MRREHASLWKERRRIGVSGGVYEREKGQGIGVRDSSGQRILLVNRNRRKPKGVGPSLGVSDTLMIITALKHIALIQLSNHAIIPLCRTIKSHNYAIKLSCHHLMMYEDRLGAYLRKKLWALRRRKRTISVFCFIRYRNNFITKKSNAIWEIQNTQKKKKRTKKQQKTGAA